MGNYDRRLFEGMVNAPFGDTVALRVVGSVDDHDGYSYDPTHRRELENQKKWNLRSSLKIDATDKLEVLAQAWFGEFRSNGPDNRTKAIVTMASATKPSNAVLNILGYQAAIGQPIGGFTTPLSIATANAVNPASLLALIPQVNALVADRYSSPRDEALVDGTLLTKSKARSAGGALTLSYELGDATLKSISGYDFGIRDSDFNVGGWPWIAIFTNQNGRIKQFTQELQLTGKALESRLTYAAGAYFLDTRYRHGREDSSMFGAFPYYLGQFGLKATNGSILHSDSKTRSYAFYGQASYEVVPDLHVTGGLRWTHEKNAVDAFSAARAPTNSAVLTCTSPQSTPVSTPPVSAATPLTDCHGTASATFENLSYTGGIDYQVLPDVLVYGKVSRGFKAGGVNVFGDAYKPLLPFEPETNQDYEVGFKSQFLGRRARVNAAYYHTDYKNIQRTVSKEIAPNVFTTATQNAAGAKIDGVEAEVALVPVRGLTLGGTLAYTKDRYTKYLIANPAYPGGIIDASGLRVQGIPKYTYTLSGGYDFDAKFADVHAEVLWYHRSSANLFEGALFPSTPGGFDGVPLATTLEPGYGLLNGSLSFDIHDQGLRITLWGKNVIDKRYVDSTISTAGYTYSSFGAPATYGVDVTKRFEVRHIMGMWETIIDDILHSSTPNAGSAST